MSCDVYVLKIGTRSTVTLGFAEGDDQHECLCTFPHNYGPPDLLPVESLALLGAAVVLARQHLIPADTGNGDWNAIDRVVPDWIKDGIKAALKVSHIRFV